MRHFGDITKLYGAELPIVDVITGGSPCQDLSVAGKRAGLDGERSGLFMEQIRLIKEMREHDRAIRGADVDIRLLRPRYMVWENVPGALSTPGGERKGEDFRCVLEEVSRIADKTAIIPKPPKGGWSTSGCIMGDGWSVAWRVHDAQFWGVPQRRKRIALVADFGGTSAPEILFERKSVSGNTEQGEQTGEETSGATGTGTDPSSYTRKACNHGGMIVLEGNGSRESHRGDGYKESETMYSLNTVEQHAVCIGNGQVDQLGESDKVGALNCMHDQQAILCYGIEPRAASKCARDYKGVGNQYVNEGKVVIQEVIPCEKR